MKTGLRGHRATVTGLLAGVLLTTGCASVGPKTITRDHFNYDAAIARTAKQELLSNIVGLRYSESPVFLTVRKTGASVYLKPTMFDRSCRFVVSAMAAS